jgi:hypothetical protein
MSIHDKLIKARLTVYDLCQGKIKWTMRIPADPANDTDLIIMDALNGASDRIAELERQNAELVAALRDVIGWVPGPQAWHTNEPQRAVANAREVLAGTTAGGQGEKANG